MGHESDAPGVAPDDPRGGFKHRHPEHEVIRTLDGHISPRHNERYDEMSEEELSESLHARRNARRGD
jgi:hypothetical protein